MHISVTFLFLHFHSYVTRIQNMGMPFLFFVTDFMRKNESLQLNEKCIKSIYLVCVEVQFFTSHRTYLAWRPLLLLLHTIGSAITTVKELYKMISLSAIAMCDFWGMWNTIQCAYTRLFLTGFEHSSTQNCKPLTKARKCQLDLHWPEVMLQKARQPVGQYLSACFEWWITLINGWYESRVMCEFMNHELSVLCNTVAWLARSFANGGGGWHEEPAKGPVSFQNNDKSVLQPHVWLLPRPCPLPWIRVNSWTIFTRWLYLFECEIYSMDKRKVKVVPDWTMYLNKSSQTSTGKFFTSIPANFAFQTRQLSMK